ncbi:MAG TPA: hypothetical protein VF669_00825 [Tepidisphaeraceae bacterium]|jgi:CRISPR/Cas system endoribonuclease Cas6 (RAMP superfamily)
MAQRQEANVPLLITIGAVSGFLFLVLAIGLQAWYMREIQMEVAQKWDNVPIQPLTDQRQAQRTNLNTYRWMNPEKTRVAIPIDEAMKVVAQGKGSQAKAD